MNQQPPQVFISHAHADRSLALQLGEQMRQVGARVFDAGQVPYGSSVVAELISAIEHADAVIFIVSADSTRSSWVSTEIGAAVAARQEHPRKLIVPAIVGDDVEIPPMLRRYKFAKLDPHNIGALARDLMASIERRREADIDLSAELKLELSEIERASNSLRLEIARAKHQSNELFRRRLLLAAVATSSIILATAIALALFLDSAKSASAIALSVIAFIYPLAIVWFFPRRINQMERASRRERDIDA